MANRCGNSEDFILGAPESLKMVTAAMKLKDATPWKESYDKPRQCIANNGPYSQNYGFSISRVTDVRVGP